MSTPNSRPFTHAYKGNTYTFANAESVELFKNYCRLLDELEAQPQEEWETEDDDRDAPIVIEEDDEMRKGRESRTDLYAVGGVAGPDIPHL